MARKIPAKRASRPNPREDRNYRNPHDDNHQSKEERFKAKKVEIIPKSLAQEQYLDALEDTRNSIVIATGPAGTGKTYLCTQYAIRALQAGEIKKIIVIRPAVTVDDEKHGFLPGNIVEKLTPYVAAILDVFKEYYPVPTIAKMIEHEIIEFVPIAFLRGRTFKHAYAILDEAQNTLPTAMLATLTRLGEGSRIFVTGDMDQHDRHGQRNGLLDLIYRLQEKSSNCITHCMFGVRDVERHPAVSEVLRLYHD